MMNLEQTIRSMWDAYPLLAEKLPKESVTTGKPGKGEIPYLTIEIDSCEPNLLTNKGHLREKFSIDLQLRHDDYTEARWIVDYLHDIFKNRMLFDTSTMLQAQTSISKTTIKKLQDQTWLFTIKLVIAANLFSETIAV